MEEILRGALLRKPTILKLLGNSNSTFYNRINEGAIKPGVPIGKRIKAWPASEIQEYAQSCIDARDVSIRGEKWEK